MDLGSKLISYVTAAALMFMVLLICVDVAMRFAVNKSIAGSYELVQAAMVLTVFFGFAYAQRTHALVHVTFFMRKFPKNCPMILWTVTGCCSAFVSVLLTYASYQQVSVIRKIHSCTTIMAIPLWPFYLFMTIAFAAFAIVLIYDAVKCIAACFYKPLATEVIANWPS